MEGCFGFDLRWVHARLGTVAKARFDTHHLEECAQTSAALEKATSALAQLEGELSRGSGDFPDEIEGTDFKWLGGSTVGACMRIYIGGKFSEICWLPPILQLRVLLEAAFSLYKLDGISLTQGKRLASINGMKELNQEQKDFQSQSKGIHLAGVYAAKMIRASSFSFITSYMNNWASLLSFQST
nr:hypothetical protein [Tanacetum cinerariifolium]